MGRIKRRGRGPRKPIRREDPHRINERINVPEVRLVVEGSEPQVLPTSKALQMAQEQELDLVEISAKASPPVCKILDYKKFLYEQKKKEKEMKSKSSKVEVKEIRFGPNTDDHDFEFKLRHAKKFLEDGAKVKAYVFFRGRTIVYKERGQMLLLRFAKELEELGALEQLPKLEGKRMIIMINPTKKK